MPNSKYIKKTKLYTEEDLENAARRVLSKECSERKAIKNQKFSCRKLRDKIAELEGTAAPKTIQGRLRVLSNEQEAHLVQLIKEMASASFAPSPKQVLGIVREFCEVNEIRNPLYNSKKSPTKRVAKDSVWQPTRKWFRSFMKRNHLSKKRTKGMHLGRFRNIRNPFLINNFYHLLGEQIKKLGIENRPQCIGNLDESGFPLDPNNTSTVSLKGQKVVKIVAGTGRENITVLAACNAAGEALPPLIVYGSKANVLNSIPPEWAGDEEFTLPGT
uniref:Transposase n=1 Tax=Romanomermis culicivorax TaxID=13658 RepID=A0A915JNA6_ROMCU